jgi:hypothetical protein
MRALSLLVPLFFAACDAPQPGDEGFDPFAEVDEALPWEQAPPPTVTVDVPSIVRPGTTNAIVASGNLGWGERVYFGATTRGTGAGPCLPAAGGLCLGIRPAVRLIGTAQADATGTATLNWTPLASQFPLGSVATVQAVVIRSIGGRDSIASAPDAGTIAVGPPEGTVITDWLQLDFADNGYRDDCAGGTKYVKSVPYTTAKYVGVTLCSDTEYKVWLSDLLYGTFYSAADWSGTGEDHCEYADGDFMAFPQPSLAIGAGQPCWSRGAAGAAPTFEASCATNRWVPNSIQCSRRVPTHPGPAEGSTITSWVEVPFVDDGYRDGCAGGDKYIKSNGFGQYVGVTMCGDREAKIWMSGKVYGAYRPVGDWSGVGEDHCEFVGGDYVDQPQGSAAIGAGQPCWSRGPAGATPTYEPTCATNRWVATSQRCSAPVPLPVGLSEGQSLPTWRQFDFFDDGYRDGCAGGTQYVKNNPVGTPDYVGVTLCSATEYKIWLSDEIFGTFNSPGDWSGTGQDHCDYVGGTWASYIGASLAVDPGEVCWSRGPSGATPVFEDPCLTNRWVPEGYRCGVAIP